MVDGPFEPHIVDEHIELSALARELRLADGFALLLARCNQPGQRVKLVSTLREQLPEMEGRFLEINFTSAITHLLDEIRDRICESEPTAVLVTGIENSVPATALPRESPFIANLNAARDSFPSVVRCPLVLWLPEYVLVAIAQGAPDFFSIRSGAYFFAVTASETRDLVDFMGDNYASVAALPLMDKHERIKTIRRLLEHYQLLPKSKRNLLTEMTLRDQLAALYYTLGDYATAEPLVRELLKEEETVFGLSTPRVATTLSNFGLLKMRVREYAEAEQLLKRAMTIQESTFGSNSLEVAVTQSSLGSIYFDMGRIDDAQSMFKSALQIRDTLLRPDSLLTAVSLNNLASSFGAQGNYDSAEMLLKRALSIRENNLSADHPDVATSLNNLANVYEAQGKYNEAESMYIRALGIRVKLFGPNHREVADVLGNYALLLNEVNRPASRREMIERAIRAVAPADASAR